MATILTGADVVDLKRINSSALLNTLKVFGPTDRARIAELTHLSVSTVCRMANRLVDEGIVSETFSNGPDDGVGRKTGLLSINANRGWMIAIDMGGSHIKATAVDFAGQIRESVQRSLENIRRAEFVGAVILSIVRELVDKCESKLGKPDAIGISTAGHVDHLKGRIKISFNLELQNFDIASLVRQVVDVPVVVANCITSATLGEARFGYGRTHTNFGYVSVGMGVGAGFVVNEQLIDLPERAGIGSIVVEPNGAPDQIGGRGTLDSISSGRAIAAAARLALESGASSLISELAPASPQSITAKIVADAAHEGDELALGLISRAAHYLGIGIVNFSNTFGITFFAINGGVSKAGDIFWKPLRESVARYEYQPGELQLEPSQTQEEAGVLGAGVLALDKVFELTVS